MDPAVNFFIESSVCFAVFYLFFELFQRKDICFNYNRIYLLSTAALSVTLPLLNIDLSGRGEALSALAVDALVRLPVAEAKGMGETPRGQITWRLVLTFGYLAGAAFFLVRLLYQFYRISHLIRQAHPKRFQKAEGVRVVDTNGEFPTSSFFRFVFWDNTRRLTDEERRQIMSHELTHVQQKHSLDVLLFEALTVFFWFNPFLYLYKRALKETHEYIADARAAGGDIEEYMRTLARQGVDGWRLSLTHSFNRSRILKRIKMLEKGHRRISWMRLTLITPVLIGLFLIFSCQNEELLSPGAVKELPEGWVILTENEAGESWRNMMKEIKSKDERGRYFYIRFDVAAGGKLANEYWSTERIEASADGKLYGIGRFHAEGRGDSRYEAPREPTLEGEPSEIFTVVEIMPEPVDGMTAFYEFLRSELTYPEQARTNGIEGRVYVEFVVDKEGTLTNFRVVKGIGGGCNEEAVRVLKLAPLWNPGKQRGKAVDVKMILPLSFRLPG